MLDRGFWTSVDQWKTAPILLSYKEKINEFSTSLQNTNLLTEDLPILDGDVDDDLVGHVVVGSSPGQRPCCPDLGSSSCEPPGSQCSLRDFQSSCKVPGSSRTSKRRSVVLVAISDIPALRECGLLVFFKHNPVIPFIRQVRNLNLNQLCCGVE